MELPAYTVKRHSRAKHPRLKVTLKEGLVVVIPPRYALRHVPQLIKRYMSWVDTQLHKRFERMESVVAEQASLPEEIRLGLCESAWRVEYRRTTAKTVRYSVKGQELIIYGAVQNHDACYNALRQWLAEKAKTLLAEELESMAAKTGLAYQQLRVRGQKSRWGSCSARKHISLNRILVFLPPELARYVILHELCHTVHLNHSGKFWALVASFEPSYKALDRIVHREAWEKYVPAWADPRLIG